MICKVREWASVALTISARLCLLRLFDPGNFASESLDGENIAGDQSDAWRTSLVLARMQA